MMTRPEGERPSERDSEQTAKLVDALTQAEGREAITDIVASNAAFLSSNSRAVEAAIHAAHQSPGVQVALDVVVSVYEKGIAETLANLVGIDRNILAVVSDYILSRPWHRAFVFLRTHLEQLNTMEADRWLEITAMAEVVDSPNYQWLVSLRTLKTYAAERGLEGARKMLIAKLGGQLGHPDEIVRRSLAISLLVLVEPSTSEWSILLRATVDDALRSEVDPGREIERLLEILDVTRETTYLWPIPPNGLVECVLAELYLSRSAGNRFENVEMALTHLASAQPYVERREVAGAEAANFHHLMGKAHLAGTLQDLKASLLIAIEEFDMARKLFANIGRTKESQFAAHARAQCLVELGRGSRSSEPIYQAIDIIQDLLSRTSEGTERCLLLSTLARALSSIVEPSQSELEQAKESSSNSVLHLPDSARRYSRMYLRLRFGEVATRIRRLEPTHDLTLAKNFLRQAAIDASSGKWTSELGQANELLGDIHCQDSEWAEASRWYESALDAAIVPSGSAWNVTANAARVTIGSVVAQKAAYCLCRHGDVEGALRVANIYPAQGLIERMTGKSGVEGEMPVSIPDICDVLGDTGIILFVYVSIVGTAVVGISRVRGGAPTISLRLFNLTDEGLLDIYSDVYHSVAEARESLASAGDHLEEAITGLAESIGSAIDDAVKVDQIPKGSNVVVVSSLGLEYLPLHAVTFHGDDEPLGSRYLLSCVPAFRVLQELSRRRSAKSHGTIKGFGVIDPGSNLRFARAEAIFLQGSRANWNLVFGAKAVTSVLRRAEFAASEVKHFACHATTDLTDPNRSGIRLADGSASPSDIIGMGLGGWPGVVVLSACETGIGDFLRAPAEPIGLAPAFLASGATYVVCSLWSASDSATALLMGAFYRSWDAGRRGPAVALQTAREWLRDATIADLVNSIRGYREPLWFISRARREKRAVLKVLEEDIHSRGASTTKPFQSPLYWAAFVVL